MASSEVVPSNDSSSSVAWQSLVRRSVEAWYPPKKPTHAMAEDFLRSYTGLDDFLVKSGSMGALMFWFFQRREIFLSQKKMTKWNRDRLDDYILLPASHGFVTRTECFFVSHFWRSQTDPDPGGEYLKLVQKDLGLQSWSYVWVDWTCLPQDPRSDAEEVYFLRALETMPAIIRNCGFMWNYPPFEPKLWILYEVAEYSLTCEDGIEVTEDNKEYVDHVSEMREVGVRATLSRHGYKCKAERDKKFLPAWLELLVLLKRLLNDLGNIREILDNLTWFPVTGNMFINTLNGLAILHPFEGNLSLGGAEYTFTPFPIWRDGKLPIHTESAPTETHQPPGRDDSKDDVDQEQPQSRIVRYRYRDGVLCMEQDTWGKLPSLFK